MRKLFKILAVAMLAVALLPGVSEAGVISIDNASFEEPDAGTAAASFTGDDWQVTGSQGAGVVYETTPAAKDGDQWAYIKEESSIYQDIGTVSSYSTYTVEFWTGDRPGQAVSPMDVVLYAGGTGPDDWTQLGRAEAADFPSTDGDTKFYSLDVATTTDQYVDQTLWLCFETGGISGNKQNLIDDVSVIPAPDDEAQTGTILLISSGLLFLVRRKTRRK